MGRNILAKGNGMYSDLERPGMVHKVRKVNMAGAKRKREQWKNGSLECCVGFLIIHVYADHLKVWSLHPTSNGRSLPRSKTKECHSFIHSFILIEHRTF